MARPLLLQSLCLCIAVQLSTSVIFYLESSTEKCLKDEVHKDVLLKGTYEVSEDFGHKVTIQVRDSKQHIFYSKIDATKGSFALTTEEFDIIDICFKSTADRGAGHPKAKEIRVDLKHGVESKGYEELAQAEKLKPLEVELKKLEDLSEAIVLDFHNMKMREEDMRDTNESTHSRVLYFSLFSMCCLICLATWQIWYLRRYFQAKKLI